MIVELDELEIKLVRGWAKNQREVALFRKAHPHLLDGVILPDLPQEVTDAFIKEDLELAESILRKVGE